MTLQEVYDSKIFHGRLTEEEAYNLCTAELINHGKQQVYIWFLHETDGKLQGRIYGFRPNSEVPFVEHHTVQQVILDYGNQNPNIGIVIGTRSNRTFTYPTDFVERKKPHQLAELARVATLDNCIYCCLTSLIKRIDELQLPATEKEELKKLIRGFQFVLASKIRNEFAELERVASLDNCNYCCLSLNNRIDELQQLPARQKEELKELIREFQIDFASKIPNEL